MKLHSSKFECLDIFSVLFYMSLSWWYSATVVCLHFICSWIKCHLHWIFFLCWWYYCSINDCLLHTCTVPYFRTDENVFHDLAIVDLWSVHLELIDIKLSFCSTRIQEQEGVQVNIYKIEYHFWNFCDLDIMCIHVDVILYIWYVIELPLKLKWYIALMNYMTLCCMFVGVGDILSFPQGPEQAGKRLRERRQKY